MTTYFYGRNSDIESFDKGSSIDTQKSKVMSYCNIKDLTIDVEICEQVSGTTPFEKREEGFKLLQSLKRNDIIICSHLDRFGRNTLNLLKLVERFKREKIQLHFVDIGGDVCGSSAVGSVFVTMLSAFSQFYAQQISEKSSATKERMRKENRYCGGKKKFGYDIDDNGFYVPCEKEQVTIRLMKMLRQQGQSYQKIAETVTKSTRKKFPVSWTYKILQRETAIIQETAIIEELSQSVSQIAY